jgi:hypothetical protein
MFPVRCFPPTPAPDEEVWTTAKRGSFEGARSSRPNARTSCLAATGPAPQPHRRRPHQPPSRRLLGSRPLLGPAPAPAPGRRHPDHHPLRPLVDTHRPARPAPPRRGRPCRTLPVAALAPNAVCPRPPRLCLVLKRPVSAPRPAPPPLPRRPGWRRPAARRRPRPRGRAGARAGAGGATQLATACGMPPVLKHCPARLPARPPAAIPQRELALGAAGSGPLSPYSCRNPCPVGPRPRRLNGGRPLVGCQTSRRRPLHVRLRTLGPPPGPASSVISPCPRRGRLRCVLRSPRARLAPLCASPAAPGAPRPRGPRAGSSPGFGGF